MTVPVVWQDTDESILLATYPDDWTLEDLILASDASGEMARTKPYDVAVILDMSKATNKIPRNVFSSFKPIDMKMPPNITLMVSVRAGSFGQMITNVGKRMGIRILQNVHFVESIEDAIALIEKQRSTINSR